VKSETELKQVTTPRIAYVEVQRKAECDLLSLNLSEVGPRGQVKCYKGHGSIFSSW